MRTTPVKLIAVRMRLTISNFFYLEIFIPKYGIKYFVVDGFNEKNKDRSDIVKRSSGTYRQVLETVHHCDGAAAHTYHSYHHQPEGCIGLGSPFGSHT